MGYHFLSPGNLPYSEIEPESLVSPAWIGGFLTTTNIPKVTVLLPSVSLVGHMHRRIFITSNCRLRNGAWSDQGLQVQEPEGLQTGHLPEDTPPAGWNPQDQGAPTGRQSCQVTPCLHDLWAPLSLSLCSQEPRTGKGGPSLTSLCSWWWTRDARCCL